MKKFCKALVAVILCMSMILGVLPIDLIGEDIAKAAEMNSSAAQAEIAEFRELLEQLDSGENKSCGVWQYVLFSKQQYAVITGHIDLSATEAEVPDQLNGADVVAIADGSFSGHSALTSVTIPGNVFAMGKNAIPTGVSVCAVNASYAQTWARKNGHGFRNASELELCSGVVDLSGTRTENFLRVSEKEVHLRELESKRLQEGKLFFLPDPANLYQISYYKAENISESTGGFVTIICSTPQAEEVVMHLSAEDALMMPDYSTLKLEPGVELVGQDRASGKNKEREIKVSVAIPEIDLGNNIKFFLEGSLGASWKTSYDVGLFSDKEVKVVETESLTIHTGVKSKTDLFVSKDEEKALDKVENWIKNTWNNNGGRKPKPYRKRTMSVAVFSYYGIINVMVDVYFTAEITGKIEISYTNTYTTTYYYHNGNLERSASADNNEISIIGGATIKVGFTGALDIYVFSIKLAGLSVFAGFKGEAKLKASFDKLGEDENHFNVNMLDCVVVSAELIVEVGASIGLGDIASAEYTATLLSLPLLPDERHYHLYDREFNYVGGIWLPLAEKDQIHWAEECPYDWKTVSFVTQDKNGVYRTVREYYNVERGTVFDASVANELTEKLKTDSNRKVLGWYTDQSFDNDAEVIFPITVSRQDDNCQPTHMIYDETTLYAKTAYYRDVYLIDSSGAKLKNFTAMIIRDGEAESWHEGKANIAGGEQIVLPAFFEKNQKEYTAEVWIEVDSDKNRAAIGSQMNPREFYTVDGKTNKPIYLMAMTCEDIVGRFVTNCANPGETINVYCAIGGTLIAPEVAETLTSELKGWEVYGETNSTSQRLGYINPGEGFSTEGQLYREYLFYADWQRKANLIYDPVSFPGFGPKQEKEYSGNITYTDENYLTFSSNGMTVTGIKEEYINEISELNIPATRSNGYTITGIASNAFKGNTHLTSVYIPKTINNIGSGAFQNCSELQSILIDSSTGSNALTSIPAAFAKNCEKLQLVVLTDRVTDIGSNAFEGCSLLESARLNCNIYISALKDCTKLSRIELGGNCNMIYQGAFENCTSLTELEIPYCVRFIGNEFIKGCVNLKKLTIAANTSLGKGQLLVGAGSLLQEVNLEDGITGLEDQAFANGTYGFPYLKTMTLPATIKSIGAKVFINSGIKELSLYFPAGLTNSLTVIAGYAFSGMTNLQTVNILGGTVPYGAFSDNPNLKTLRVANGRIGGYAFGNCTGLQTVELSEGVKSIGENAFKNCTELTRLEFPDSITYYGPGMIIGCTNLTYLRIGGGVANINANNNQSSVYLDMVYNPFYIGDGSKLQELVLNEGITSIGKYLFANVPFSVSIDMSKYVKKFPMLTKVSLPSSLTSIGDSAFEGAQLTSIDLAYGLADNTAFSGMTTLKRVHIRGGNVKENAFAGCSGLIEVILEEGVTGIGNSAFRNCTSLTSLDLPDSITSYGSRMIEGCTDLTYLKIGGGVQALSAGISSSSVDVTNPFYIGSSTKLKTLVVAEGVTSIDTGTLANATQRNSTPLNFNQLEKVVLPSTLTYLDGSNISGWKNTKNLMLPDGINYLYEKRSLTSGLVLYSIHYNSTIQEFATQKNLTYINEDRNSLPRFNLICVVPTSGAAASGQGRNESIRTTRGLNGEETDLEDGFTILSSDEIIFADPVVVEDPVVKEGYTFYGWYTDPEFKERWGLAVMPASNITLYARVEPLIKVKYAVNLASAGDTDATLPNGFVRYQEYGVQEYEALPMPADPAPEGYTFFGWFMDPEFTRNYIPRKIAAENLTIYGRLEPNPAGAVYELNSNNTYTLKEYHLMQDESSEVHIPAKVNGIPVTAIAAYAFTDGKVKTLYIPDTVTEIDHNAFAESGIFSITVSRNNANYSTVGGVLYNKNISKLIRWPGGRNNAKFAVPASVRTIGAGAFEDIQTLKTITFNTGLEQIEEGAFRNCSALRAISLPESVTVIGREAFAGCYGMTDFTAYGLTVIGENAIPAGGGLMGWGPVGDNPLRRCFASNPNDVTGETLNYNLYTINLYLDGVKSEMFGSEAGIILNAELKNIFFDDGTQILAWYKDAEFGEVWDLDNDLMPAEELNLYASKTPIFNYESLTLTVDEEEVSGIMLTKYNGRATTLVIPEIYAGYRVIALGDEFLAEFHGNLASISIPDSVILISNTVFINADEQAFTGVIICDAGSAAEVWAESGNYETDVRTYRLSLQVEEDRIISYEIGKGFAQRLNSPERIGAEFTGWYADETLQTPVTLTNGCFIMPGADTLLYAGWTIPDEILNLPFTWEANSNGGITITGYTGSSDTITIPATIAGLPVNAIGQEAFMGTEIRYIDLNNVSEIGERAFAKCTLLNSIFLPDSVTSLDEEAFLGCAALRRIEIGAGLVTLPISAVTNCSKLKTIEVSLRNALLASNDGILLSKDGTKLICWPMAKQDVNISIPDGVTEICDNAFRNAIYPETIVLPASVTSIGKNTFAGCIRLHQIQGTGLISVGEGAFFGCESMENASFGNALESVGSYAFGGCGKLDEMIIPETTILDPDVRIFGNEEQIVLSGRVGSSAYYYALARGIMFNDPEAQVVAGIIIHGDNHVMQRGETMQLTVEIEPENAEIGTDYTWTCSNNNIAFVDGNNIVHAIGGGEVELTATSANGIKATYAIEVQVAVASIELRMDEFMLPEEALMPEVMITPATATNKTIEWTSSDETVAVYDPDTGMIRSVGTGETVITVTAHNGLSSSRVVRVYVPIEDVSVTTTSSRLFLIDGYNTEQAAVQFEPANATDQEITWSSSNPDAVSVSETGKITALAQGTAIITASGGNQFGENWQRQMLIQVIEINHLLRLPAALTTIEDEAFWENSEIEGVILDNHVNSIGEKAFAVMFNLQMVVIPSEEISISESAFLGDWLVIISPENSDGKRFAEENNLEWLPLNAGD